MYGNKNARRKTNEWVGLLFTKNYHGDQMNEYESAASRALLSACFMLISCLVYSSTLKMEATCSSETSVDF
jgi:hypothetical protein